MYSAYINFRIKVMCYKRISLLMYNTDLTKDRFYGGTFCDNWRKIELCVPSGRNWCYECWTMELIFSESATSIYTAAVYFLLPLSSVISQNFWQCLRDFNQVHDLCNWTRPRKHTLTHTHTRAQACTCTHNLHMLLFGVKAGLTCKL